MTQTLRPHPATISTTPLQLSASAERAADGRLALTYALSGALDEVRLPAAAACVHTDELWKHTCFEAFVRIGGDAYLEFNVAPSGAWAAYRFEGYRAGGTRLDIPAPRIIIKRKPNLLALEVRFVAPGAARGADWRMALCSVIEETNGDLSYWALAHPPGKPDFHHIDSFTMNLPADRAA